MSERGFVTVTLLAFLPILAALLAAIVATYMLLKADGASKQACRVEVLRAQKSATESLTQLIGLNSRAATLRIRREIAQAAVEEGNAGALVALQLVISQQVALATQQNAIIAKAKLTSFTGPQLALQKAKAALKDVALHFSIKILPIMGHASPGHFHVIPSPPADITPDYQPSSRFRDEQEMKVDWSFDLTSFLPEWIRKILRTDRLKMSGECSATMEKGGLKWEPKITVAKSWSSY